MGRPARDFEGLFQEFVATNLPRSEYLKLKGISPWSGSACRNTLNWESRRLKMIHGEVSQFEVAPELTPKEQAWQTLKGILERPAQADACLELSNQLGHHIQFLLTSNLGPSNSSTTLSINDIAKLTDALSQLQVVQRRSTGLNIGPAREATKNGKSGFSDPQTAPDYQPPVYATIMTEHGKFRHARPKKLEGIELTEFLSQIDPNDDEPLPDENLDADVPIYAVYMWNADVQKYQRQIPRLLRSSEQSK